MNADLKIRLLWFLLTLSFIATALTISLTFHSADLLQRDAATLQNNLHKKERYVLDRFNDKAWFGALKRVDSDGLLALDLFNELRTQRSLFLFTYRNHKLVFWGANRLAFETDAGLKEGSTLISWQNGYYEAIKKTEGDFSAVCYIPIKTRYPYHNLYLVSAFDHGLISSDHLEVASLNDTDVADVRSSINNRLLFSVKLKPPPPAGYFDPAELYMWLAALLSACVFLHVTCSWIAARGFVKTALATLAATIFVFRVLALHFNWLSANFDLDIFNPIYYSGNFFFPSIGDFLLNGLAILWFLSFAYYRRKQIRLSETPPGQLHAFLLFGLLGALLSLAAWYVNESLYSLVVNSSIRFDLFNSMNLNEYSWLGILIICLSILNLYLLIEILLPISKSIPLSVRVKVLAFLGYLALLTVINLVIGDFKGFFLLFALIVFLKATAFYNRNNEFNLGIFVFTVFLFATIASIKLTGYQYAKDLETRKLLATKLEMPDDQNAVTRFASIETSLSKDETIARYFQTEHPDYSILKNKLQKFYLDGYLTRYDFSTYTYDKTGRPLDNDDDRPIDYFKELVLTRTIKVTEFFYRINNTFGNRHYFAIIPINDAGNELGTLVIDLQSKTFQSPDAFPPVLVDGLTDESETLRNYSFAFYKNGTLVNQFGDYVYDLNDRQFDRQPGDFSSIQAGGFDHLVYKLSPHSVVVVSSEIPGPITRLGAVSFLFVVILGFSVVCAVLYWGIKKLPAPDKVFTRQVWKNLINATSLLYKTRIQASIVAAVITTLVMVGAITVFSIASQYRQQQQRSVQERINKIATSFENQMVKNDELILTESLFNGFADLNATDLSFFSTQGNLMFTTQPKIYEMFLVSQKMNAEANIHLNILHQSAYINTNEYVARMYFMAAYKPIRNSRHETIGYLCLPYFSNEHDLAVRLGQFLNTLVNVYALVMVAIGFFAVFMANQITFPLTIIQKSLRQTKIGSKNEPILWNRNDEIGSLIREYNEMIGALEESAGRLARSERETAWKEMAKQVAHEIKNPLTPLKLGVQLLDKSWREKDPHFAKKFEKFSKSFIEQIESLAHIANEFSNFAKMPETSLEAVRLREVIDRSIEVFNKIGHVTITLEDAMGYENMVKGDKDQLMRCFNNLIKNAIEAVPENRPGAIRILVEQREGRAKIEISDNGKGIPDGLRDRIFNPNFTTKSSGTGLGLAFVKQAIENMGGSISFVTAPDKGTTFYITLPLA